MGLKDKVSYYGVYDGHGGAQVAQLCEKLLHKNIIEHECFLKQDFENCLAMSFSETDKALIQAAVEGNWHSGSTVVVTIIHNNVLHLANVGDAEAILARKDPATNTYKPIQLSHKHKPTDNDEKERIKKLGGYVVLGRVMGSLAVARALGDKDFKKPFNNAGSLI